MSSSLIWGINPYQIIICQYFLPFRKLSFHFVDDFLPCAEAFWFDEVKLLGWFWRHKALSIPEQEHTCYWAWARPWSRHLLSGLILRSCLTSPVIDVGLPWCVCVFWHRLSLACLSLTSGSNQMRLPEHNSGVFKVLLSTVMWFVFVKTLSVLSFACLVLLIWSVNLCTLPVDHFVIT